MTNYEYGLKRTADLIGLHILSFVEQAQERCDITPCEALNDLTIEIIGQIKAQRRRLEKQDTLRDRVLQEIAG